MSDRQQHEHAPSRRQDPPEGGSTVAEARDTDEAASPAVAEGAASSAGRENVATAPTAEASVFIPRITAGAFVEDASVRKALSLAADDRRMMRASLEVTEGDIGSAAEAFRNGPPPELVIVESRFSGAALFEALEALAEQCPPGTRVILIGHENDVRLYRQLLKFGIGDYLVAPLEPIAVIEAIGQLFQEDAADRLGKVIAFVGARGGAGSSTVAVNVAAAIGHECRASCLLVDLDLTFGTAALELNLEPAQGVREALDEGDSLDATLLDRLTTMFNDRLSVLAAPGNLGDGDPPAPETVSRLIDTARTATSLLLLDLPHEWSPLTRRVLLAADEVVITATPDLAALRNARNIAAALKSARQNDVPPRLVLNGFGVPKRKELSAEDYQRVLDLEPAAHVPHDAVAFSEASAKGEPVALGSSAAAQPFRHLARMLTGQKAADTGRRGVGGWARRLLTGQK